MANSTTEVLDNAIADFFGSWSTISTLLLLALLTVLVYPLVTTKDPDVHPFLLARQAAAAPIRNANESAVYRALDVPHGYPLRSGLGVKDEGAPKWSQGRRGDLRDVWRQAARGLVKEGEEGGFDASKVGKILTVLGREKVVEQSMGDVTEQINAVGAWMKKEGMGRCAVCLSNSVELLAVIFAAAFYDFPVILIPYGIEEDQLNKLLSEAKANALVAEAGTFNLDSAFATSSSLKQIILVSKGAGGHMSFDEPPKSVPGGKQVSTWSDILDQAKAQGAKLMEVPLVDKESTVKSLSTFVSNGNGYQLVEFSNENLISGIAGLNATTVRDQKLGPSDTILPTSSLTEAYTLCWVLAALFANASVALNSVAGEKVDLALATAGYTPTIVVAGPVTVKNYLFDAIKSGLGPGSMARYFQSKTFASGVMPSKRPLVKLTSLSKVRLLLVGQPKSQKTRLTSSELHELRLIIGSRIGYALTAPSVAGAVSQTNLQDYRDKGDVVCVGPPLGSVEVHLLGEEESMGSNSPQGKIVVKGPAVAGGSIKLDCAGRVAEDSTLCLL